MAAPVQAQLATLAIQSPLTLTVDVAQKKLMFASQAISFELDPRRQVALLSGADEIAETLQKSASIDMFRVAHRQSAPWLYDPKAQT